MLRITELGYRVAGRPILEGATLSVNDGERVGLIGRNGSGKTTLLKLIAGDLQCDAGDISLPARHGVGTLPQDPPSGPESLIEAVLAADRERTRLLEEAETAPPERLAEVHERLAAIQADSAPARASRILAGLGFDEAAQAQPCASLSGGWRMRVALAAILFRQPDLLLLDEPTNHLDLEATVWLESFLKRYPGTLILVSHDRRLLNQVPERIVHLEELRLVSYRGNYDRFEQTRRERLEHQAAQQARQLAERKHIQSFVDRFRYKASKARQAQSRLKALERMQPIASVIENRTVAFAFPKPKALSPPIVNLEDAAVGYRADKPVLEGLNLRLDMDDRIALLGANGNGKSTFARLLAGRLKPGAGRMQTSSKLSIGYFSQDQAEELNLEGTPLDHMALRMPLATPQRLRSHLGAFGFGQDKAEVRVGALSGGEKARLLFALMSREAPQLLLLDEPTNHLDVDSRQALVEAINDYEGAVILVSHDAHLIELVADRLWLVADGTVTAFDGDLDDYRRLLLDQRRAERRQSRAAKSDRPEGLSRKEQRRAAAQTRAAASALRKEAQQAEKRLAKLTAEKAQLEESLADPGIYDRPNGAVAALQVKHGAVVKAIAEAETVWLEAQAALEEAR